jgi:hypothetical protein
MLHAHALPTVFTAFLTGVGHVALKAVLVLKVNHVQPVEVAPMGDV